MCAQYLLSKRNPVNGAWGLFIEGGSAPTTASIVNTAEALFVINRSTRPIPTPDLTQIFLRDAIEHHPLQRGNNLRFLTFGLMGLLEAGVAYDDPTIFSLAERIEDRFVDEQGWGEQPDEAVRLWPTFQSLIALNKVFGREYIERRYGKLLYSIILRAKENGFRIGFSQEADQALAATSYLHILASIVYGEIPLTIELHKSVVLLLSEALRERRVLETEALPGADWHHYAYCWGLEACYSLSGLFDEETFRVSVRTLTFIDTLFRDGRGYVEPDRDMCNVRSIYNNVLALHAVIKGFDPTHYKLLEQIQMDGHVDTITRSIFLSFSYDPQDKELVEGFQELLRLGGYTVLTGEKNPMGSLSTSILHKIRQSEKMLVIMTRRDKKEDGSYTTSSWLLEEKGAAIAMGKPCLMMVEEGIDRAGIGGLQGDDQRLHFTRNNFLSKVTEALRMLG